MGRFIRNTGLENQRGLGAFQIVLILALLGATVLLGLKLTPHYLEYFSVKKVITAIAAEDSKTASVGDIRKSFDRRASVEDIKTVKAEDLEITKEGGETVIRAAWEQRIALFKGYTLVVEFAVSSADR